MSVRIGTPAPLTLTPEALASEVRKVAANRGQLGISDTQVERIGQRALNYVNAHADVIPTSAAMSDWLRRVIDKTLESGVSTEAVPERSDRLAWLGRLPRAADVDVAKCPMAARVAQTHGIDLETAARYLTDGLSTETTLSRTAFDLLTPEQRQAYHARMRDLHNVLWTGACADLSARASKASPSDLPDVENTSPSYQRPYASLTQNQFVFDGANAPAAQAIAGLRAGAARDPLAQATDCVEVRSDHSPDGMLAGNFYLRVPVGEFGPKLSYALADAARIIMSKTMGTAAGMGRIDKRLLEKTVLAATPDAVLREGIASIATTIALLLAKNPGPPLQTAADALTAIDDAQLVTQIAGKAPFGVLAPLATVGLVPTDAIGIAKRHDGSLRAQLPESLVAVCDTVMADRKAGYQETSLPAHLLETDRRTETLRGCPVAGRGPVMDTDGNVSLSAQPTLTTLTHVFIEITKQILAERD